MNIPKKWTIELISFCPLKCSFCWNKNLNNYSTSVNFDLLEFKKILKWLRKYNIYEIDLTPMVGEAFLIKNIEQYFEILEKYSFKYSLHTSLAVPMENLNFEKYKNLTIYISFYGSTSNEFLKITGKNNFNLFRKNLIQLKHNNTVLILRDKVKLNKYFKNLVKIKKIKLENNSTENRPNKYSSKPDFENNCIFLNEPIIHEKGISSCCMDYQKSKFIIGKIYDNLTNIYKNLEIPFCNSDCGWYTNNSNRKEIS